MSDFNDELAEYEAEMQGETLPMPEEEDIFGSTEVREKVLADVRDEVQHILSGTETQRMHKKWEKWRRQREARPEMEEKSFPWPGASNVSVPISMTNANGIYALLKASIGARKPLFTIEASNDELHAHAKSLQKLLQLLVESPYHVNMTKESDDILYDLASLGTQIVKIPWITDRWQYKRRLPDGGMENVTVTRRDSPAVVPIPLEDFICRPFYSDLQRAPLIGHRIFLFEHELRQREAQGIYRGTEDVIEAGGMDNLPEEKITQLEKMGITPDMGRDMKLFEIHELYAFEDVDGDGIPEDVILWIDPVSETLLRSEFNELGIRPYVNLSYLKRPGQLYSIGTGWMSESMQEEIDALHNMRIDGTKLSMLQMYVTRRGSGIASGEMFRPLKNIQADNPKEDFIPIKFPDISYGTVQAELLAKEYADRATGASDAMMGFENRAVGTRATASGTMFLAQQGSKMFKALEESVEYGYGEIARILVFQLVHHREKVESLFLPLLDVEDQDRVRELLELEVNDIPSRFQFAVSATDIDKTEEVRRQNMLTLTQLYTMYGERVFGLLPIIYGGDMDVPEPIKEVAAKFFIGATKMMEEIFTAFGEMNAREYLPLIKDLEMMVQSIESMRLQQLRAARGGQGAGQGLPEVGAEPPGGAGAGGPSPE